VDSHAYATGIHKRSPLIDAERLKSGEGIVQPLAKAKDQLPRRLHQQRSPCTECRGFFGLALGTYIWIWNHSLWQMPPIIAGIIDGEGTITLPRKHKNENRQLAISVSNNEHCLLDYLLHTLKVGKITNKRVTSTQHAPNFTYAVYNRQALWLLHNVAPPLKNLQAATCPTHTRTLHPLNAKKRQIHEGTESRTRPIRTGGARHQGCLLRDTLYIGHTQVWRRVGQFCS